MAKLEKKFPLYNPTNSSRHKNYEENLKIIEELRTTIPLPKELKHLRVRRLDESLLLLPSRSLRFFLTLRAESSVSSRIPCLSFALIPFGN